MYITGDIPTFESRLHQLAENQTDLNNFITEGTSYLSIIDTGCRVKWNKEFSKREMTLSGGFYYSLNNAI
jgi:hypothetical protein